MAPPQGFERGPAHVAGPSAIEDIAARLGITVERVLLELRRLAFFDIRRIVEWDEQGMKFRDDAPDDMVAIIEIVASASSGRPYRIKVHDKKPVLETLSRALGVFPKHAPVLIEQPPIDIDAPSAREKFIAELDRIAAEEVSAEGTSEPER